MMRELLGRAIAAIEKLPAEVQDAVATRLLAEAADEPAWAAQFAGTTDAQWDRMAEREATGERSCECLMGQTGEGAGVMLSRG